jgi:hypothetical protein
MLVTSFKQAGMCVWGGGGSKPQSPLLSICWTQYHLIIFPTLKLKYKVQFLHHIQ